MKPKQHLEFVTSTESGWEVPGYRRFYQKILRT